MVTSTVTRVLLLICAFVRAEDHLRLFTKDLAGKCPIRLLSAGFVRYAASRGMLHGWWLCRLC